MKDGMTEYIAATRKECTDPAGSQGKCEQKRVDEAEKKRSGRNWSTSLNKMVKVGDCVDLKTDA